ncbi:MAG: hypothetical protein AAGM67_12295, partial [Bacteroidota bacterium]
LQDQFALDGERAAGLAWLRVNRPPLSYFFKEGAVHHSSHLRVSIRSGQAMIILSNTDNLPEIRWMADQIWPLIQSE